MHAASYELHKIDPENAKRFFHGFTTGEDLPAGHPVLALRNRFTRMEEHERWRSGPTLGHILTAWNLFIANEKVTRLPFYIGKSKFPEIEKPLPIPESSRSSARVQ